MMNKINKENILIISSTLLLYLFMFLLPKKSAFEMPMSIFILKELIILLYLLILSFLILVIIFIKNTFMKLYLQIILLFIVYNPEFFVISGNDNYVISTVYDILNKVIKYAHVSPSLNVFLNWPIPYISDYTLYLFTKSDTIITTYFIKNIYLILTLVSIYLTVRAIFGKKESDFYLRVYFIAPLVLLYTFKVYQLTTASFLPLFGLLIYITLFKQNLTKKDYIITSLFIAVLPFSHGFSTLSLVFYLLYFSLYQIIYYKSKKVLLILILAIVSLFVAFRFIYASWIFTLGLSTVINTLSNYFHRTDILILIPQYSGSIYSFTYRLTLELGSSILILLLIFGVFSKIRDTDFWKRILLPMISIMIPAIIMQYSIETIPRVVALSISLITATFLYGYKKVMYIIKDFTLIFTLLLALVSTITITVAILGQPFNYINSINSGLYYFTESYGITTKSNIRAFALNDFITPIYFNQTAYKYINSQVANAVRTCNLIYNGLYSQYWSFGTLLFLC